MKLRNKKTGEILKIFVINSGDQIRQYDSLAELNEEWEDYEDPKYYWYIDADGNVMRCERDDEYDNEAKEIGNYFETKEEAEKAVRELKAWKRLRDKGFRFIVRTYETDKRFGSAFYKLDEETYSEDVVYGIDLLFGGEE